MEPFKKKKISHLFMPSDTVVHQTNKIKRENTLIIYCSAINMKRYYAQ